jgi:multiple sugar transport system substrate-binding protein
MKKITAEEKGVYGYVLRGQQGNPVVANFMPVFWSFGAQMFDEKLKPHVNSPEGIEALKFFIKLKEISPPGAESFNAEQLALHLQTGTAAATINWPAFVSTFEDPKQSKVVGKIKYSPIPSHKVTGSSEIGHWLVAIPKASKNKEEAFDFILWLTSAEVQKKLALDPGSPPTRKSVFLDTELNAKPENRHYPVLMEAIENSTPRPRIAEWNEVENAFGVILSSAVAGKIDPVEAMHKANKEIEEIMKRAGHYQ